MGMSRRSTLRRILATSSRGVGEDEEGIVSLIDWILDVQRAVLISQTPSIFRHILSRILYLICIPRSYLRFRPDSAD